MKLKNIISVFVLLLSLTSCKEKEDMDKKYHWIAEVKAVSGYPVLTRRGFVYNKEDVSRFGTSRSSVFERKEPFPHFAIDAGVGGLAASAEREVAKGVPTHLDVSWFSYVEGCEYLLENQPLDSLKIAQLLQEKVYVLSENKEDTSPNIEEYNISVGLAPGGVVIVWLHHFSRTEEVGRYQAKKTRDIHFVTQIEADAHNEKASEGNIIMREHTIEDRDYEIKWAMPKERILMEYRECATPVTDTLLSKEDLFKIPYGLWDSYRKRYKWKMTLLTRDKTKYIHSYFYLGLNREMEELFGERVWRENQIEKYKIPEKFRYTYLTERSIPSLIRIRWYDEKGSIYRVGIRFNVKEVMDVFTKAFEGQEDQEGELVLEVNQSKTDFFCYFKVGDRKEWICNGRFFIYNDGEE